MASVVVRICGLPIAGEPSVHLRARVPPPPFARRCAARVGNLTPGCGATGDVPRSQRCGSQGVQVEEGASSAFVGFFGVRSGSSGCSSKLPAQTEAQTEAVPVLQPTRAGEAGELGVQAAKARAALPQPPCSHAHAALYRSRSGPRTPRCQPDFQGGRSPLPSDRFRAKCT